MSNFRARVGRALERYNMLSPGDRVIVALSGGADSVSLLNVLLDFREEYSLEIAAAHVNHNLRGEESQSDESFVKNLCKQLNIQLFVKSADVGAIAQREKISCELSGRNVRYEFFSELADAHNAKIATAHTADDNAETLVFNMLRGAGVGGMCGILPLRGKIIRPLIYVTRAQVEEYCREEKLNYVTDSTNLTDDYTRNKIRHNIIPLLKELNPNFTNTTSENAEIFREVNSYLEIKSGEAIEASRNGEGYDCQRLLSLPDAVRFNALYALVKEAGVSPGRRQLELLDNCLSNGGCVDFKACVRAVCSQGTLRLINPGQAPIQLSDIPLRVGSGFTFNGKEYSVKEIKASNRRELLDISLLDKKPVFRTRRPGDVFTLPGRNVTKSLKKLFIELKIPRETRNSRTLIAHGSDILWIEGIGVSAKAQCTGDTGLQITAEPIQSKGR